MVSRGANGHLVRLGDLARVEIAPETLRDSFAADGKSAVGIGISRQSTANTLAVIEGAKAVMEELRPNLPAGMELVVLRDSSVFIEAAVHEVRLSLVLACILVIAIVFLFLGSVRAALVPAVTVPISLIAAFTVMYALGFSVNLLTLLALVLSIGILVDDSIIVLENIHRRIEDGEPPLLAAYRGASEVAFAVIASTLVLVAVFVPISLMGGDTGRLFTEFAFAMAAAIAFSGVVALTLSPMMCSKMLRPRNAEGRLTKTRRHGLQAHHRGLRPRPAPARAPPSPVALRPHPHLRLGVGDDRQHHGGARAPGGPGGARGQDDRARGHRASPPPRSTWTASPRS